MGRGCLIAGKTGIKDSCPIFDEGSGGGGEKLIQTTQNFFLQQLTFLDMGFKK